MNRRTIRDILADAKALAIEYHAVTGRPLGITGEIAEFEAADKLDLELALVRSAGYDAVRKRGEQTETIQIKGRRRPRSALYKGRVPKIDVTKPFDTVALVLLGEDYSVVEIWEAPKAAGVKRLSNPGSKARNERGSMGISQFRSIAIRTWPGV